MRFHIKTATIMSACLLVSACATAPQFRSHPRLNEKLEQTQTVTVIPLRVDVYQISAGGVQEKIDEWSAQARNNLLTAVEQELQSIPLLNVKPFSETILSEDQRSNLEQTGALFDAISSSIILHTYGPPEQLFPEKIQNFDYSLGPEVAEFSKETDTLLLVRAVDHIATAGRKALQTGTVILGALVGVSVTPNLGVTVVSIAFVDAHSGEILWYNYHGSAGDHDLRNPIDATILVKDVLKDFPIRKVEQ
jgi:hypothetical protein